MAIQIREAFKSRSAGATLDESRTEVLWHVFGSDSETAMLDYLIANAGDAIGGHSSLVLPRSAIDLEQVAPEHWLARVDFSSKAHEAGDSQYSFDTTGGSTHITQSRATLRTSADAPDYDGAINVSEDRVDGVDITIPSFKMTETHEFAEASITLAYLKTLSQLTGSTNDAAFRGWSAGEVLFLGASGTLRTGDEATWSITYSFDMQQNVNVDVGALGQILKEGWAYLWVAYKDTEDGDALVKQPKAAYVEQVYPESDFSLIGI